MVMAPKQQWLEDVLSRVWNHTGCGWCGMDADVEEEAGNRTSKRRTRKIIREKRADHGTENDVKHANANVGQTREDEERDRPHAEAELPSRQSELEWSLWSGL